MTGREERDEEMKRGREEDERESDEDLRDMTRL
jgi:hypothetical protein